MNEHAKAITPATYTVAEGKARLSELLARAAAGEKVHITRHGKPYAVVGPAGARRAGKRKLPRVGAFAGEFELPETWDSIPTGFETYR